MRILSIPHATFEDTCATRIFEQLVAQNRLKQMNSAIIGDTYGFSAEFVDKCIQYGITNDRINYLTLWGPLEAYKIIKLAKVYAEFGE